MTFVLKSALLIVIYVAVAKMAMTFGTVSHSATLFWPSGGIALAAVLLGGQRYLPAVFISACFAAYMVDTPLVFGLGSAIGNVLETYLGYSLLTRAATFNPKLHRVNDLITIFVLGAMIPAMASATLGPMTLLISGMINIDMLPVIIWRWWRADVLGIVFFTPLILVFSTKASFFRDPAKLIERMAVWVIAVAIGLVVFLGWEPVVNFEHTPTLAWIFPVILWAGLRTGKRNTALIQLLFFSQSLMSAYLNVGIFGDDFTLYGLENFWIFSLLLASLGMALAIMASTQRFLARQNKLHAKLFEISHDGVMITDANNNIVSVNPAFTDITGYTAGDVIGKNPRLLASGRQSKEFYEDMWKTLKELGHWKGDLWNRRKDGAVYLQRLIVHAITDDANNVVSMIGNFSDITRERSMQETIAHHAHHDFMTNLPNRMLFDDRFKQQLAYAARHNSQFAVIYMDLDDFKPINDTFGHQVGDHLLVAVAGRLSELVREVDTISRFGGDEFAILVSDVMTVDDVIKLANKIIFSLGQPFTLDRYIVNVSASLGIALYPDHGIDMEAIMSNADAAMYEAKRAGNNCYVIAEIN